MDKEPPPAIPIGRSTGVIDAFMTATDTERRAFLAATTRRGRPRALNARPPDGLRTPREAAAKLRCSPKTLSGHVASGALRYVIIGHGSKRVRKMFADADLDQFIANQTRRDVPICQSTKTHARRTGISTSSGAVIAFTAAPKPRPSGTRKK